MQYVFDERLILIDQTRNETEKMRRRQHLSLNRHDRDVSITEFVAHQNKYVKLLANQYDQPFD